VNRCSRGRPAPAAALEPYAGIAGVNAPATTRAFGFQRSSAPFTRLEIGPGNGLSTFET